METTLQNTNISSNWDDAPAEKIKLPNIKKYVNPFRIVLAIAIILAAIVVYNFGWLKIKNSIYQKGVLAGQNEINNMVVNQFLSTGSITLVLPVNESGQYDVNGQSKATIILVPNK